MMLHGGNTTFDSRDLLASIDPPSSTSTTTAAALLKFTNTSLIRHMRSQIVQCLKKREKILQYFKDVHFDKQAWLYIEPTVIDENNPNPLPIKLTSRKWQSLHMSRRNAKSYFSIGLSLTTILEKSYSNLNDYIFTVKTVLEFYNHYDSKKQAVEVPKEQQQESLSLSRSRSHSHSHSHSLQINHQHQLSLSETPSLPPLSFSSQSSPFNSLTTTSSTHHRKSSSRYTKSSVSGSVSTTTSSSSSSSSSINSSMYTPTTPWSTNASSTTSSNKPNYIPDSSPLFIPTILPLSSQKIQIKDQPINTPKTKKSGLFKSKKEPENIYVNLEQQQKNSTNNDNNANANANANAKANANTNAKTKTKTKDKLDLPQNLTTNPQAIEVLKSLKTVSEDELCFIPDPYQCLVTLIDTLIIIYRNIYAEFELRQQLPVPELMLIENHLKIIDNLLRNLIFEELIKVQNPDRSIMVRIKSSGSNYTVNLIDLLEKQIVKLYS